MAVYDVYDILSGRSTDEQLTDEEFSRVPTGIVPKHTEDYYAFYTVDKFEFDLKFLGKFEINRFCIENVHVTSVSRV